jgi:hypothetical protein
MSSLRSMSEENHIADFGNFSTAIDQVPALKVEKTLKNHEDARGWICNRYNLPTDAPFAVDHYLVYIGAFHGSMDHVAEKAVEKYRDDSSGSRRENHPVQDRYSVDPFELQELRSAKRDLEAIELELRYDPPRGKSDPRVARRDELLRKLDDSPFFNQDGGDRDRKKNKFLQKKASEASAQLPLDTPDESLRKYSAEQIRDLLKRRKEEREKVT